MMMELVKEYGSNCIDRLSEKYGFNKEEAMRYLDDNKEGKRVLIPLPFCGVIVDKDCCGLKLNHGLYTQCQKKGTETIEINDKKMPICKSCSNQAEKNTSGKPNYGVIEDRLVGKTSEFRDPKGKQVVRYGNIMEKLNISRERAENEAAKLGWTIPEEEFEVKKARRGRPKKNVVTSDTESEASIPKKRGRPKKEKTVVSNILPGDDLIASLVAQAHSTDKIEETPKKKVGRPKKVEAPPPPPPAEESDEEEIEVRKFTHKGVDYLRAADNVIYTYESEVVGVWNEDKGEIDLATEDED